MAKFIIGDRVRFLNDVGGGIITQISDNKMAVVQTEDGFDMPVMMSELVKDAYDEDFTSAPKEENPLRWQEETEITEEPVHLSKSIYKKDVEVNVLLGITTQAEKFKLSDLAVYLINDSEYYLFFNIGLQKFDKISHLESVKIEPETKILLDKIKINDLFRYDSILFQGILYYPAEYKFQPAIDHMLVTGDLTILKLRDFKENDYFDEKAYIHFLNQSKLEISGKMTLEEMQQMVAEKVVQEKKERPEEKKQSPDIEEVDLHIYEIMDDYRDLSNSEILRIQMDRFETVLETALRSDTKKIVFIHGVGNGSLKHELRSALERKYHDLKYQDASFKEYGYGATLIYLK